MSDGGKDTQQIPVPTLVFGEEIKSETSGQPTGNGQNAQGEQTAQAQNAAQAQALSSQTTQSQQAPDLRHTPVAPAFTEDILSEEERKQVAEFSQTIDLNNSAAVIQYGAGAQKKMADFSEKALANVRTKDLGEVGDQIAELVTSLGDFDTEEKPAKGIMGLFKKTPEKLENMKAKYDRVEVNVDKIAQSLEDHQVQLIKDIAMLDKMYELNLAYYKELTMYIVAGKKRLEEVRAGELAELNAKAERTGMAEDVQAAKDLDDKCERFEKRLYDLELTRTVALQTAPQIRLVQDSDQVMVEKIQSTLVNTIPLWKNQMVIAMGVEHSNQAARTQQQVTDMTNKLLQKNAEKLKMATVETAKAAERGIVDVETLKATNQTLITTLDEVVKIQEEGRAKRRQAELDMQQMEQELKGRLLAMSKNE